MVFFRQLFLGFVRQDELPCCIGIGIPTKLSLRVVLDSSYSPSRSLGSCSPLRTDVGCWVTAEEASTAAPTEVEVATDAPVDAVKMPETMVEEAEPAAPVGQHPVDEKASPEEAAPVVPKELEVVEQADVGALDIMD